MRNGVLRSQGGSRYSELPADVVRNRLEGDRTFSRSMQSATSRCLFDGKAKESSSILSVDRGPSIRAITHIRRNACPSGGRDE